MTNLVIGSEGFIGKYFYKFLKGLGEKVIHFDIKRDKKEDARYYKFNFKGIDRIYFLAWEVGGAKYLYEKDSQLSQLEWNIKLLTNLLPQLAAQKTKFVFVSSQLSEEETVYGVTKKLGELWSGLLGAVSVRLWNAYGSVEPQSIRSHVISDFVYQAVKFGQIKMLTDGSEWRQFTHLKDICRGLHTAMTATKLNKRVYDVSSFEWIQVREVAEMICRFTKARLTYGAKSGHSVFSRNLGRLPGWLPTVSLEKGLNEMVTQAKKMAQNGKLT